MPPAMDIPLKTWRSELGNARTIVTIGSWTWWGTGGGKETVGERIGVEGKRGKGGGFRETE